MFGLPEMSPVNALLMWIVGALAIGSLSVGGILAAGMKAWDHLSGRRS